MLKKFDFFHGQRRVLQLVIINFLLISYSENQYKSIFFILVKNTVKGCYLQLKF